MKFLKMRWEEYQIAVNCIVYTPLAQGVKPRVEILFNAGDGVGHNAGSTVPKLVDCLLEVWHLRQF